MTTQGEPSPLIAVSIVNGNISDRGMLRRIINGTNDLRCVSVHATAEEALREIPGLKPRVVVMDVELPRVSVIGCTRRLKAMLPELLVLILCVHAEGQTVWKFLLAGADGFCVNETGFANVPDTVRHLVNKGCFLDEGAIEAIVERSHDLAAHQQLAATLRQCRQPEEFATTTCFIPSAFGSWGDFTTTVVNAGFSLTKLARACGQSVRQFERKFRQRFQRCPREVIQEIKMELARRHLRGEMLLKEIATHLGYNDAAHFSRAFKAYHKVSPSNMRLWLIRKATRSRPMTQNGKKKSQNGK